jgi:hypothetical protein
MTPDKAHLVEWASYLALAIMVVELLYLKLRDLARLIKEDLPPGVRRFLPWIVLAGGLGALAHACFA